MKVALVIGNYDAAGGGAERWTDRFARWLLARGHEVHLYARRFRGQPDVARCHVVDDSPVISPWKRLHFAAAAERELKRQSFDIVHDMGDGWHADVFMPHHGTRAAGFLQNTALQPRPLRWSRQVLYHLLPRYREFQTLEKRQYREDGRIFVALSQMVREHMRQYYRVDESSIEVIHNGIDTDRFQPLLDHEQRRSVRRDWGFNSETVFLLVAHNFRLKGLDTLLVSLAALSKQEKVGLVVAGKGKIHKYREIAAGLGVGHLVRFLGDVKDPRPIYHGADAYVQPTYYDPCSLVVLEALACGLPAITTHQNGVSEIMTAGCEGFLLENADDHLHLTNYMGELLDPQRRREFSLAARSLAEQNSLEYNCTRLMSLYERIGTRRNAA